MAPFQRIARRVLVENAWHRYCLDRYTRTDGSIGSYYYIDMHGACGIVPLFEDGTTALLRVHRYLLGRDLWELPIGGVDAGETPEETARRELRQEAGLLADRWHPLGRFAPYKGVSNELTYFFLARSLRETARELEPSEGISVHRVPLDEARARICEQDPGDGQSMVGLLLLDRFLAAERRGG